MKTKFQTVLIAATVVLLGFSCSKSDEATPDKPTPDKPSPVYSELANDLAIVFGDNADKLGVKLCDEVNLTERYVNASEATDSELDAAIGEVKEGGMIYFVADLSAYGDAAPEKLLDALDKFGDKWSKMWELDCYDRSIQPLYLINIATEKQAEEVFGINMGKGWYVMSDDLERPSYILDQPLEEIDFEEIISQYVAARFPDNEEEDAAETRAEESPIRKMVINEVSSIKKIDRISFYSTNSGTKQKPEVGVVTGLPSEAEGARISQDGGFTVNTEVGVEVGYIPGGISSYKCVLVTLKDGYHISPYIDDSDVFYHWWHTGDAYVNYMLKNYTVDITLRSKGKDGIVSINTIAPDIETPKNYEMTEVKEFSASFSGKVTAGATGKEKGVEAGIEGELGFNLGWKSSQSMKYSMTDMFFQGVQNKMPSANSVSASWTIAPEMWNRKPAFINNDKTGALDIYWSLCKLSVGAGLGSAFNYALRNNQLVPQMNYTLPTHSRQCAFFDVNDSDNTQLEVVVTVSIKLQNSYVGYVAGTRWGCYSEDKEVAYQTTKVIPITVNNNPRVGTVYE